MNTLITDAIKNTEGTFAKAIDVIQSLDLTDNGLTVFTDDENHEVWLMKEGNSGSYLRTEFTIVKHDFNFGGFTADMHSRTLKDTSGKGYIDSTITIAISDVAVNEGTVNIVGIKRAVEVLTEGYIRSLEVLYNRSSGVL